MDFDFIEAAGMPLTKTFRLVNGQIEKDSYPLAKYVTSHREQADTLEELLPLLEQHAAQGHCLIKGLLSDTLINQSRAGKTNANTPTSWLLLDLDFTDGYFSVDDFIAAVNPAWSDVSYIFQHSASAGVQYNPGLRGHVFIMLDTPIAPATAKQWLKERNLEITRLREKAELSTNGMALKWPLDISTCQSDKLIYIAPPVCEAGVTDPLAGKRFELRTKSKARATPPAPTIQSGTLDQKARELVHAKRKEAGLPKRTPKYKTTGEYEILNNPDQVPVTGSYRNGNIMRLNLDGGDSWGYWFYIDNPTLLHNFKDEPIVRLRDIAPDYYRNFLKEQRQLIQGHLRPLVYRDPISDKYFNALYNRNTDLFELNEIASSKDKLKDFMKTWGEELPDPIQDWTIEFDPTRTDVLDIENKWINLYTPTQFIRNAQNTTPYPAIPEEIDKLITSITVDEETKNHFLNWLAHVFQTRERPQTAWVFHGAQGTGKGMFLQFVLQPLFGKQHCPSWTMQQFEEKYNDNLETASILWLDEFQMGKMRSPDVTINKLKTFVTESRIGIRRMRSDTKMRENYLAVILTSNQIDPIRIDPGDRRFNIAPPQDKKLIVPAGFRYEDHITDLQLHLFASYLWNYKVSYDQVRTVLQNEARENMINTTTPTHNLFFDKLRSGDLEWFIDFLPSEHEHGADYLAGEVYRDVMTRWCRDLLNAEGNTEAFKIHRDEARIAYNYILNNKLCKIKFTKACNMHDCTIKQLWRNNKNFQGLEIAMQFDPDRARAVIREADNHGLTLIPGDKP